MIFELQNKHFGKWLPVGQLVAAAAAIDQKKIVLKTEYFLIFASVKKYQTLHNYLQNSNPLKTPIFTYLWEITKASYFEHQDIIAGM